MSGEADIDSHRRGTVGAPDPLAAAEDAAASLAVDPTAAARHAAAVLDSAPSLPAIAVARRVLAVAAFGAGRSEEAAGHISAAIDAARAGGDREREAAALLTAVAVLASAGRPSEALDAADRAAALDASPAWQARIESQRGFVHRHADRFREAVRCYDRALASLAGLGDAAAEAVLRHNRGTVLAELGAVGDARRDLEEAVRLHAVLGHEAHRRSALANLASLAALEGDVASALRIFDELGVSEEAGPLDLLDMAACFVNAGLVDDAGAAARLAVERCRRAGSPHLAEALAWGARAARAAGAFAEAVHLAAQASAAFAAGGRDGSAALAALVAVEARRAAGEPPGDLAQEASALVDRVGGAGLTTAALDARVLAGECLLAAGRREEGVELLADATREARSAIVRRRVLARLAAAELEAAAGRPGAARRQLATALVDLDGHVAAAGGAEVQLGVLDGGAGAVTAGLRLAVEAGPRTLFTWSEWAAAGHLRMLPVRPPDDPEMRSALGALRALNRAAGRGEAGTDAVRRRGRLERTIRQRARGASGARFEPQRPVAAAALAGRLAERALVSYAEVDGDLHAVTVSRGRFRKHRLGPVDALAGAMSAALVAQRGLRRSADPRGAARALGALHDAAARVAPLVIEPVLADLGDEATPLVVVPSRRLVDVPWSALPGLTGRSVSVAPSATVWARADDRVARWAEQRPRTVLAVAGPRLECAPTEARRVRRRYAHGAVLTGRRATVAAVHAAIAGASVVHFAAHGELRPDNPLLSSLLLADGPLTAYDLEPLAPLPPVWVLSACDVGRLDAGGRGPLLGLATTLLRLGAGAVVAAAAPLPDAVLPDLAARLHTGLAAGRRPATVLAEVRATATGPAAAAAMALTCIGGG